MADLKPMPADTPTPPLRTHRGTSVPVQEVSLWQGVMNELMPFEGRMAMAWRTAAVCALAALVFMTYEVPLVSIGCYLIMFLAKPNAQENILVAIGITLLVSLVVLLLLGLTRLAIEVPMWRLVIIVLGSYFFLFIGAASVLGPGGNIVALVIGFIMTLLPYVPFGEVATRGILYAWLMVLVPMGVIIVFHTIAGRSARMVLHDEIAARLNLIARAIVLAQETGQQDTVHKALMKHLREGQGKLDMLLKLVRLFHLAPSAHSRALEQAISQTQDMLVHLAASRDPSSHQPSIPDQHDPLLQAISTRCRSMASLLKQDKLIQAVELTRTQPLKQPLPEMNSCASLFALRLNELWVQPVKLNSETTLTTRAKVTRPVSGRSAQSSTRPATKDITASPGKSGFFKEDAWRNPEYSRFAIKTTAAAVLAYIIYTSIQWDGIHTAMITCYVAALGTTGETVHKLTLRIIGCLIGAAMGMASLAFLIPYMTSVGQLMILVFAGVLVAAWVSSGSERISYAGIQIGLAFLMTVLQDFKPDVSMSVATDRIYGILLGNALLFIMFTRLWPVSVTTSAERKIKGCQRTLTALRTIDADSSPAARDHRRQLINECLTATGQARETLIYNRFEPSHLRASPAALEALRHEIDAVESSVLTLASRHY